ncbi:MAG TPA: hypothetical protein VGS20_16670 [Candidatus Acidoferrales bacterium]|nr:hypothetical protein [Candidatus Acidoferrales bacterium]
MPIVFVIARDWPLRAMVRAELRERGIQAVGMTSGIEAGIRVAAGEVPSAVVIESSAEVDPGLASLAQRVPFVVVASNDPAQTWPKPAARVLHRPVRVAEVVKAVLELLRIRQA